MAHFPPYTDAEVDAAVAAGRTVLLVGQRRSGLSHWTNNRLRSGRLGHDQVAPLDLAMVREVEDLRQKVASTLGLGAVPVEPRDLQLAITEFTQKRVVVLNNCHKLDGNALGWLLRSIVERVIGPPPSVSFVMEGALDVDSALERLFPNGLLDQPLLEYADATVPWRTMVEAEDVLRSRPRQFQQSLMPWVVDQTGGDVKLMLELFERLPTDESIDEVTLQAARKHVVDRGTAAAELREAVRPWASEEVVRRLVTGEVIQGLPPASISAGPLKALYLAGAVSFDSLANGYRIRSPVAAEVAARVASISDVRLFGIDDSIHARTAYFIWQMATVELELRSLMSGKDCVSLAAGVSTLTPLKGLGRRLKDRFSKCEGVGPVECRAALILGR